MRSSERTASSATACTPGAPRSSEPQSKNPHIRRPASRRTTARERAAVGLVASAVALGIVGDVLFQGRPLGVNAVLFAAAFVAALAAIMRVGRIPFHQGRRLMSAPLLLFAGLIAWHASPLLLAANLLAVAGAVTLGALRRTRRPLAQADVSDYVAGAASAGAAAFAGAVKLFEKDMPRPRLGRRIHYREGAAIGKGLALGLPLLVLFGGLFVAADAVFRSLLVGAVPDVREDWSHLLVACAIGWLAAGLLRDLLATREAERVLGPAIDAVSRRRVGLGPTEIAVALAVVDAVFLGLTELRLYATGTILWLGVVFVWLGLTVLRGRPRAFASGAVLAGFAATLALNAVNPDALIARTNIARPHVDAAYLGRLSDDAVPDLLARLPSLDPKLRRPLATALLARGEPGGGPLAWNASRSRAQSLLAEHRAELQAYAGP